MKEPIYGLLFTIPEQEKMINKHCFGDCGKIICAGLDDKDLGPMFPCRIKDCPHKEQDTDDSIGDVDGDPIFLRKLKEIK